MKGHYLRIGLAVIVTALVTYVFFPVNAEHTTSLQSSVRTSTAAVSGAKSVKSANTDSAKHKQTRKTSNHNSTELAKSGEPKIEPDKTLRKEQSPTRSGPPSKMYGGM